MPVKMIGGRIFLSGGKNHIQPTEQDEDSADFSQNNRSFGFLIPVHILLDKIRARSGENNHGTMADAISDEQGDAIGQAC